MIKRFKKGLTLIELVVTIAVVAILTGAAVGTYFGVTESSKHSRAETEALTFFSEVQNSVVVSKEYNQYKVSLSTKDGLIFSRYSPETIEDFVEQVSAVEHRYNAVIGSTVQAIKQVEPQEKPTVYFFNTYYRNDGDVAEIEYFGYVPSGFAGSYVKVVDFKSGTIVNDPQFTTVPYHTPAPWVEPEPEPEPTLPKNTKIVGNLYLYAPNFNNNRVGLTQVYKIGDEIHHFESRKFDYEIDYIGEYTYRFPFTFIYGYDNYIQLAQLDNNGNYIEGTETDLILVKDSHINASMRYMNVPGIYDWQVFNLEDYSDIFEYFVVGTINGNVVDANNGKYGLSRRAVLNESNKEYRIEQLYLKTGDKLIFKEKNTLSGKTFNYTDLDVDDKKIFDTDENNYLIIKEGYSGKYSFYLKPNDPDTKLYATATLDKSLTFEDGLITTSAATENGYQISRTVTRLIDSDAKLGTSAGDVNKKLKFKFKLSATEEYAKKQEQITGKLTITVTNPDGHMNLGDIEGKIYTTSNIYYNINNPENDNYWKNTLHDKTIGNNLEINGGENTFNLTVFSDSTDVNGFEHIVEISHPTYSTQPVYISLTWEEDTSLDFVTIGYGPDNWHVSNMKYRLNRNVYFTASDNIYINKTDGVDPNNIQFNDRTPEYMYMVENVKFDKDTEVKVKVLNEVDGNTNESWITPGWRAFDGAGTGDKAGLSSNDYNFILKAGITYRIYCFAITHNGKLHFLASEAHII